MYGWFWNLHNGASIHLQTGTKQIKEKDKLKEAAKEGLDVMQFIAGETPTQPISLVCSWLKTTLELIPLTCPHNHALSTGPHQQAWSDELVHRVHKIQVHFNIVHHYAVRITGDALKVRWKINKHMLFIFIQILIEGEGEGRGGAGIAARESRVKEDIRHISAISVESIAFSLTPTPLSRHRL